MEQGHIIAAALITAHVLAAWQGLRKPGSVQGVLWLTRVGVTIFAGMMIAAILKDLPHGIRPPVVIGTALALLAMGALWFRPTPILVWGLFVLQCAALSAAGYYLLFYRFTRLF